MRNVAVTRTVERVTEYVIEVPDDLDFENESAVRKYAEESGQLSEGNVLHVTHESDDLHIDMVEE